MSLTAIIRVVDGRMFVVYDSVLDCSPKILRMWWRVERVDRNSYSAASPEDGDIATSISNGVWRTWRVGCGSTGSAYTDGQKEADRVESIDVPCPKVRKGVHTNRRR